MIPPNELLDPTNPADLISAQDNASLDNLLATIPAVAAAQAPRYHFTLQVGQRLTLQRILRLQKGIQQANAEVPLTHTRIIWSTQPGQRRACSLRAASSNPDTPDARAVMKAVTEIIRSHFRGPSNRSRQSPDQ